MSSEAAPPSEKSETAPNTPPSDTAARSDHQVRFVIDSYGVTARITCGAPHGAWCRMTCPRGCEAWTPDHEHELVDNGKCLAVEWFDNEDAAELYRGPEAAIHDGAVDVSFSGDYWEWCYV